MVRFLKYFLDWGGGGGGGGYTIVGRGGGGGGGVNIFLKFYSDSFLSVDICW